MSKIKEAVENIISELDGRKGFDFYDFDEEILDEIKEQLSIIVEDFYQEQLKEIMPSDDEINEYSIKMYSCIIDRIRFRRSVGWLKNKLLKQ